MSSQILLSGGDKYYSYSGILFGDVSAPATISMITIDNTGLRDSYVKIQPYYGTPPSTGSDQLGVSVLLDDVIIFKQQIRGGGGVTLDRYEAIELFMPRNSKLEIISNNVSAQNTQERGVSLIGYYL